MFSKTRAATTCLVIQNAGVILATKYSFREGAENYSQATALLASELLKLLTCVVLVILSSNSDIVRLKKSITLSPTNAFMLIPATLYVLQNLLQMSAIHGLSPTLYVTGVQLKVLSSAIFSVLLLKKKLTRRQITSFFPLMAGVALVQWDTGGIADPAFRSNQLHSLICLLGGVTISGLAGVLLEFTFKREGESIWAKNMYLALFSIPPALYVAIKDIGRKGGSSRVISEFVTGFDAVVILVIVLLALGGLLTAVVMKHAGTLAKCYAVSLSIVVCSLIGVYWGLEQVLLRNVVGAMMVIGSVFLYSSS